MFQFEGYLAIFHYPIPAPAWYYCQQQDVRLQVWIMNIA